jgi:hypothetical protein
MFHTSTTGGTERPEASLNSDSASPLLRAPDGHSAVSVMSVDGIIAQWNSFLVWHLSPVIIIAVAGWPLRSMLAASHWGELLPEELLRTRLGSPTPQHRSDLDPVVSHGSHSCSHFHHSSAVCSVNCQYSTGSSIISD